MHMPFSDFLGKYRKLSVYLFLTLLPPSIEPRSLVVLPSRLVESLGHKTLIMCVYEGCPYCEYRTTLWHPFGIGASTRGSGIHSVTVTLSCHIDIVLVTTTERRCWAKYTLMYNIKLARNYPIMCQREVDPETF